LGAPILFELPAALRATERGDGNADAAQGFHVAMNGALGNFKPFGEFAAGEAAIGLQQEQSGEEAIGFHGKTIPRGRIFLPLNKL
jgi:hypothetical protein